MKLCRRAGFYAALLFMALAALATATVLALRPTRHLPSDAYIWQETWQEPLRRAIVQEGRLFRGWRVLANHIEVYGNIRNIPFDASALQKSGLPVILVVRIEEQRYELDAKALIQTLRSMQARAQKQGLPIAGLEIDYDCPPANLAHYAQMLSEVRGALGPQIHLSITALPIWMTSRDLRNLLAQTDEAVLQVHALRNPQGGLFNADLAHTWTEQFAQATNRPFRVALPTYGSQMGYDAYGNPSSITSAAPLFNNSAQRQELVVSPRAVRDLMDRLAHDTPPHLAGFVWFRLPTDGDRRAWRAETLRAVIQNGSLDSELVVTAKPTDTPNLFAVWVRNAGNIDSESPSRILLPQTCHLAEGSNGYAAISGKRDNLRLVRSQLALLHPGEALIAGQVRCLQLPEPKIDPQA